MTKPRVVISTPQPSPHVARDALEQYIKSFRYLGSQEVRKRIQSGSVDFGRVPPDALWGMVLADLINPVMHQTSPAQPSPPPQRASPAPPYRAPPVADNTVTGDAPEVWRALRRVLEHDVQELLEPARIHTRAAERRLEITYPASYEAHVALARLYVGFLQERLKSLGHTYTVHFNLTSRP
ncbi:hypothetical protein [Deinococcus hopiensis]|uniref:Uncharacterized protein n=1 Tax=Deinococcus hopiensis KR-140 TaxID=695939 RepID=A0A1W1UJU6_9DEIO|nr:hypothetical protein [Deinococcus hopiensis]SMB81322.1 hypothetical protein SAMN00790413_04540 [Deinococcus hopiensis KR-140]